jgi:penicillin-binding protein 1A
LNLGNGGDWGVALADVPSLSDISPWRMAVVLETYNNGVKIGLQPSKNYSGVVDSARETGVITPDGVKWTKKALSKMLAPGDVIYVEPIVNKTGEYRLRQVPTISGAIVAMDPFTGRVHAMVGGFSFDQSQFNRATQALRQPGSAFKPFVYATALDNGYTPSSVVMDGPITISNGDGTYWTPTNYGGQTGVGPKTLRYGIQFSKNLMTVRLAQDIGMPIIAEYARRFGIYDDMLPVLAMSLGAGETTVLRMVTAYGILANGGKRIKPTLIDRVQDRTGKTIYRHDERECPACVAERWENQPEPSLVDSRELVIDPMTAYQITSMMESVVQRGTAQVVKSVGKPIAGKTGTTNDSKDVWFVGYSADLVVGIYLGYDRPRSLGSGATGGGYSAPIGRDFFAMALKDKPATPFRVPPGMKLIRVNAATGMRASAGDGNTIMEVFKPGTAPPDTYTVIGGGYYGAGDDGVPLREDELLSPDAQRYLNNGGGVW